METRLLEYFVAVADERNVTAAAGLLAHGFGLRTQQQ